MKRLTLTDAEHEAIVMRLVSERAAQMDAARQADEQGKGLGDGWREQAEKTRCLLLVVKGAETL